MRNGLATMLLIGGVAAVLAAVPQLLKLVRLKHATEFNLLSWFIWLVYQSISVAYSLQIKAYVYAVINALWSAFYLIMVILIIRYRQPRPRKH